MPLESSPSKSLLPENQHRRRRRRRWWSCIPQSLSGADASRTGGRDRSGREKTNKASCFPWPSLWRVRRSLSLRRGASMVAPELELEDGRQEGEKDAGRTVEFPAFVVATVRPTFLQRLFKKGARSGQTSEARRSISPQGNPSETIILPHPPTTNHHPIAIASHSSPQHGILHQTAPSPNQASPSPPIVKPSAATPKSRSDKKACNFMARSDSLAGFGTTMVMLLMLAVGGRVFAIVSTCAFFYLSSFLKASPEKKEVESKEKKHNAGRVDYGFEEHRKRVFMEGLLERNGRRAARA